MVMGDVSMACANVTKVGKVVNALSLPMIARGGAVGRARASMTAISITWERAEPDVSVTLATQERGARSACSAPQFVYTIVLAAARAISLVAYAIACQASMVTAAKCTTLPLPALHVHEGAVGTAGASFEMATKHTRNPAQPIDMLQPQWRSAIAMLRGLVRTAALTS